MSARPETAPLTGTVQEKLRTQGGINTCLSHTMRSIQVVAALCHYPGDGAAADISPFSPQVQQNALTVMICCYEGHLGRDASAWARTVSTSLNITNTMRCTRTYSAAAFWDAVQLQDIHGSFNLHRLELVPL